MSRDIPIILPQGELYKLTDGCSSLDTSPHTPKRLSRRQKLLLRCDKLLRWEECRRDDERRALRVRLLPHRAPFVSNTLYAYEYSCIHVLNMLDCYDER